MKIKEEYRKILELESPKDEHHTMKELYFQRTLLWAVICNTYKDKAFKAKFHEDGTMYDEMFIAVISTDIGDYSFHIKSKYWDLFDIEAKETYENYDEHKPEDIGRLLYMIKELNTTTRKPLSYEELSQITQRNYDKHRNNPIMNPHQFTPKNFTDEEDEE